MIRYWLVVLMLAVLATPSGLAAQPSARVWRIGVLMPERPGAKEAIAEGLREFNYVEGRNVILDYRVARRAAEFPKLTEELLRLKPDLIVTVTGRAALVVKAATSTVPIVMTSSGDAVAQGLVASLARPGGNVTGLTSISPELVGKRLDLLKEAVPRAARVAALGCPVEEVNKRQWSELQPAAQRKDLRLVPAFLEQPADLSRVLARLTEQKVDAVLAFDCGMLDPPERVTRALRELGLPTIYPFRRYVDAGGLMSYGPNSEAQYRHAAVFVDKILRGAKPADLPVEQPTKLELVINMNTVKALGLSLPPALLLRADQLIEP